MDTVKVVVFDPQEVWRAMADQRRHLRLLLPLHQDGHEVVDLVHVHVPHVVTADQHLDTQRREQKYIKGEEHGCGGTFQTSNIYSFWLSYQTWALNLEDASRATDFTTNLNILDGRWRDTPSSKFTHWGKWANRVSKLKWMMNDQLLNVKQVAELVQTQARLRRFSGLRSQQTKVCRLQIHKYF